MKLTSILACAVALASAPAFAVELPAGCTELTTTGHQEYPPIAWRDGPHIVGPAADLVKAVADQIGLPVNAIYAGTWTDAQAAARDGKVDIIFGIYFNDERAQYLDFVKPAFAVDPVVAMVAKDNAFTFKGPDDLIGKRGVTNLGESYGVEFDKFMADKLTVARADGIDQAFDMVLRGDADYLIAGLYAGRFEAAKAGIWNQLEVLKPDLVDADMYVAFSKKSPCLPLAGDFGTKIGEMVKDGRVAAMIKAAEKAWER